MAWLYDVYDAPMEWLGTRRRRRRLISQVEGDVLEVGVGTGKNLPFYPGCRHLTGIDISERMLARARARADRLGITVHLQVADVTDLPFANNSFDTTVATSLFCSVGDPITGLAEVGRVTKPGGKILLLEHVRPLNPLLGWLADLATAITRRLFGFRANRRTEDNIEAAGLRIDRVRREGVWREIEARPGAGEPRLANKPRGE
ncbi:MAG: class I SAM-dependent methyltransferase [Acidimicrobiia bacterium]|nr:class I SAM-dependent methyltransferase [Acidimicrobiia bacterium]